MKGGDDSTERFLGIYGMNRDCSFHLPFSLPTILKVVLGLAAVDRKMFNRGRGLMLSNMNSLSSFTTACL